MADELRIFHTPELFMAEEVATMREKVETYLLNHPDSPLILGADTLGGIAYSMVNALEAFRALRGERMTTYVAAACWSSGLLVMAAADRRVALRTARFMIHEPMLNIKNFEQIAQRVETVTNLRNFLDEAEQGYHNYFGYLDYRTSQEAGFWRSKAQPAPDTYFYSAEQMLGWNLLTHIVDSFDEMREIALQA